QPLPQGQGQQGEGDGVAARHRRVPDPPTGGCDPQREGGGDLEEDRAGQPEPGRHSARERVSTSTTPATMRSRPVPISPVNGSPNRAAERRAVAATPRAPQIP